MRVKLEVKAARSSARGIIGERRSRMPWSKNEIKQLFSPKDYTNGLKYVREGRVHNLTIEGMEENCHVTCQVQGTLSYDVAFRLRSKQVGVRCTCPRYAEYHICKHIAAAMIAYWEECSRSSQMHSNPTGHTLLHTYLSRFTMTTRQTDQAHLVPTLHPKRNDYPSWSFQVGIDRLYIIQDIFQFVQNIRERKTVAYGKRLTLCHTLEQFDPLSQSLIRILLDQMPNHSSYAWQTYGMSGSKNRLTLKGYAFERWFTVLQGTQVELGNAKQTLLLEEGQPQLSFTLHRKKQTAALCRNQEPDWQFFGDINALYALGGGKLLHCNQDFQQRVAPLLANDVHSVELAFSDFPIFCSCVVPTIQGFVELEDPDGLLEEFLPDVCVPQFYLDLENMTLLLQIVFQYGTNTFDLDGKIPKNIKRNILAEEQAYSLAQKYFQPVSASRFQWTVGEDTLFDFLTTQIKQFEMHGEVFISERLRAHHITTTHVTVSVSVSQGILSLQMDTGEFPRVELESLYQSLLKKRRYHRLKDGRLLALDGSPLETLAEMVHTLQLSAKELSNQNLQLPAFRALYVEDILKENQTIEVQRDEQFRNMVQRFYAIQDNDYPLPESLHDILRPYQKTGFQWLKTLESGGFGGILADEMGLGKTLQVITYLTTACQQITGHPNLVICPTSLLMNWMDELTRFAPELQAAAILGTADQRKQIRDNARAADVWVTSYELLRQDIAQYTELKFYCCILDEAQYIKNQSTQISKAVKKLNCQQRYALTGTPIENRLSELWNLFDFLMPGYLFSHRSFIEKLEKPVMKSDNYQAHVQLKRLVQPFMLRRLKHEVLQDLPPKIEHVRKIYLSEEERRLYHATALQVRKELENESMDKLCILAALTRLRQICCSPGLCYENYQGSNSKLDATLELCASMVENGHQILLFSQFTTMLEEIRVRLEQENICYFMLQGSTPKEKRAQLVKAFNRGEASVFLISLKAGGTGLNLTAADVVIHYDPWWNLAAQNQATDRTHRIGQQNHVQVYQMIAKDTIEERILELQAKKATLMESIGESNEGAILQMSQDELLTLLNEGDL